VAAIIREIITQKAGKVLTVDSDPEVTRILEVHLSHANFDVISAQSGAEALTQVDIKKPDIIILDPALPDIDGIEICHQLKELPQTSHIPIILISARTRRENRAIKTANGADHHIIKPFDPKEVVALVQAYLTQKGRAENINPFTGLPNQIQMNQEIAGLIRQKKIFAVIYIALDGLRAFNKAYGYNQGDRTINLLANIVSEAVGLFGNPDDLAGHLGGDKFVVISTPGKARTYCQRIIADFDRQQRTLYSHKDLLRSYIEYKGQLGVKEQSPLMSLRLAVVTNQRQNFYHHLEVSEAAAEQLEYLRRFPGNKCYFDLQTNCIEPPLVVDSTRHAYTHREELNTMHGVLAWLDFLIRELNKPIILIKDCLVSIESIKPENLTPKQGNSLKIVRENVTQLVRVTEGLVLMTRTEGLMAGAVFEEVNVGNTLNWIIEQVREIAEQGGIKVNFEGAENIGHLMVDRRNLTQGLLYIVRSEIQSSPPGGQLYISAAEMNEEFIIIKMANPNHYIPRRTITVLLKGQTEGTQHNTLRNELYPAKLLLQSLGGKLSIESERGKGTTYAVIVPKRWQSWFQKISALQLATEISRKEARAELKKIYHLLSSLREQVPPAIIDSLEKLGDKVQELGILCNRSLFLTDDLNSQLETQHDQLLLQEVERLATWEAMLTISKEFTRPMHMGYIFNLDSAKRVAKNALNIANEFRLSEGDRQTLRHAAILKDLGLVLSPNDMVEQMVVPTLKEAMIIKERFYPVWKTLSTLPFLSTALAFLQYRYERYDGMGNNSGAKGTDIPLGARILAVADTFDNMTSGLSQQGKLIPKQAVQKIVDDSGLRFDPDVVNAFLQTWRRTVYSVSSEP